MKKAILSQLFILAIGLSLYAQETPQPIENVEQEQDLRARVCQELEKGTPMHEIRDIIRTLSDQTPEAQIFHQVKADQQKLSDALCDCKRKAAEETPKSLFERLGRILQGVPERDCSDLARKTAEHAKEFRRAEAKYMGTHEYRIYSQLAKIAKREERISQLTVEKEELVAALKKS